MSGNRHVNRIGHYALMLIFWIASAGCLWAGPTYAAEDTLARLAQTGRIVLGAHDASMPLSYRDASGAHIGYQMDVCLRVVRAIQQRYDLPLLKVVTVPSTLTNRYALLNNKTIDIECGHNVVSASAQRQALLTHATMVSEVRVMTVAENKDLTLASLGGKTLGLAAGDAAVPIVRALSRASERKVKEVFGHQATDTFALLETGRVDAVAFTTPYMMAQRALSATPSRYVLLDGMLLTSPLALMFRLEDENLHALANDVLARMMKNGEMEKLYNKWFMQPIPGLPMPVGVPLPDQLRAWFNAPGSEVMGM